MKLISGGPTHVLLPCSFKWSRNMIYQPTHPSRLSHRNMTYVEDTSIPVWNKTLEKTEGQCQNFHGEQHPTLFFYWPEDNPLFHHCCTPRDPGNASQVPQYKYSQYGPKLRYATFYDVGFFDQCLPFWKCQNTYSKIFETQLYTTNCEFTDLTSLYKNRFWRLTVWKYSLLQTILPWILILEGAVFSIAVVTIFLLTRQRARYDANLMPMSTSPWENLVSTGKKWLKSIWKRLLMDWSHLYLLAMVGNGLLEATRRQTVYSMQSKAFYDYSMLYLSLFIILSAASLLQQVAYWIACATGDIDGNLQGDAESHPKETDEEQLGGPAHSYKKLEGILKLTQSKNLFSLTDDYKWQPIAAQAAILFALGSFLTYAVLEDDEGADMWGLVLGFIVQVGCLWTGIYAVIVFFQRAAYIINFLVKPWDDVAASSRRTRRIVGDSLRKLHG